MQENSIMNKTAHTKGHTGIYFNMLVGGLGLNRVLAWLVGRSLGFDRVQAYVVKTVIMIGLSGLKRLGRIFVCRKQQARCQFSTMMIYGTTDLIE